MNSSSKFLEVDGELHYICSYIYMASHIPTCMHVHNKYTDICIASTCYHLILRQSRLKQQHYLVDSSVKCLVCSYNSAKHAIAMMSMFMFIARCYVIVKPHHEEDIFVITRGRGGAEAEV